MSENIYTAPKSNLEIEPEDNLNALFYIVSPKKFLILFIGTFGIYSVYWYYKNWSNYRSSTGESLWPIARGVFSIFFVHSLLSHVDDKIQKNENLFKWNHNSLATIIVVLMLVRSVLDRLSQHEIGHPHLTIITTLLLFPIALFQLQAQQAINTACNDSNGSSNHKFTVANYVWLFLGLIFWFFVIVGFFILWSKNP
jgi:hypothetical protein